MIYEITLISLIGGLCCLDRIFIQIMVSRPIIIAPVTGMILGDVYTGVIIGAILELFWIDRIPIGTYIPPNDSIAAVLAASVAIFAGREGGGAKPDVMALAVMTAIPMGLVAKIIDVKIMALNNVLSDQALEDAKKLDVRAIELKNYPGLARVFAFYVIFLLGAQMVVVPTAIWIVPMLPSQIHEMLKMMYYFMPLLGIAAALHTIKLRGAIPVFCVIFLAVAIVLEFLHVF